MALDARYAELKGLLASGEELRICRLLEQLGFRLWHPVLATAADGAGDQLLGGLREFREHLGGDLTITLLVAIGRGFEVHEIDERGMLQAVRWLERRRAMQ